MSIGARTLQWGTNMVQITIDDFLNQIFLSEDWFTCDQSFSYKSINKIKQQPTKQAYYAICAVNGHSRRNDHFKSLNVMVCDDVGTKANEPDIPPSYIIETSPNNFQYGYILDTPITDIQKSRKLITALIRSGYTDAAAHGIVRLVRLPFGVNGKDDDDKRNFPITLTKWSPTVRYSYDALMQFLKGDRQEEHDTAYSIPDHIPNGSRNTEMTKLCGYLLSTGLQLKDLTLKMVRYNETLCETPLSSEELQTIINSIYSRHMAQHADITDNVYHIQSTGTWYDFRIMTDVSTQSLNTTHLREFPGKKGHKPKLADWLPKQDAFKEAADITWVPVPYGKTMRTVYIDNVLHVNTWRGYAIDPEPGDVQPWLNHLEHIVPEEEYRRALLWWIAYTIQCPDKRTSWQPIILGISGAGKDALFRPIAQILGSAYKVIGNKDIMGDYDDGILGTKLLHISEASGLRGASVDFYKRITAAESSNMLMLNIKCKGKVMQHNLCNVLVITNNIDAMKFTDDERRAFVLRSYNVMTEAQQVAYFDNWLDNNGAAFLFDYLLKYDLSEYKPGIRPYRTTHFEELLGVTQSDIEIKIEKLLEDYEIALPDMIRAQIEDGDRYGTSKIIVWLQANGWQRWDNNDASRRIKRRTESGVCAPKSRHWYVRKKSKFVNCSPTAMCHEVERVEAEFMRKNNSKF